MNTKTIILVLGSLAAALTCSNPTGERQGLNIVSGGSGTDTISSIIHPPFTVQLLDGNLNSLPNQTVYFETDGPMLVAPLDDAGFVINRLPVITDANGVAAVWVVFKTSVGPGKAVAIAPNGQTVTGHYRVLPGAPAHVRAGPRDTSLYVGGSETLRPFITDAQGNRRSDTVSYQFTSLNGALSINGPGKASGTAIGRGLVSVQALGFTDTVRITDYGGGYVMSTNLDGSALDTIPGSDPGGYSLGWLPGDTTLALNISQPPYLVLMNLNGVRRRVVTDALVRAEWYPQSTVNGSYIFFSGIDSVTQCFGVWRIHPDGTALEHVVADTTACGPFVSSGPPSPSHWPSLSPDGTQLAYADRILRLRTIATGLDTSLGVVGEAPDWSPTGQWIAYDSLGTFKLIRPDGTGDQVVARVQYGALYFPATAWSPDGQWLVYRGYDQLILLQVSTGLELPLPFTVGWADPIWRH